MLDHGDGTGQPGLVEQALQGTLDSALTRDDLLDYIALYWLTNTGVSAARLYWENKADFFNAKNIAITYAISVFPDELYQARTAGPNAPMLTTSSTTTGSTGAGNHRHDHLGIGSERASTRQRSPRHTSTCTTSPRPNGSLSL
jgi:hypothetical protein